MPILSIVMFLTSLGFLYFIFRNINKNKILFEHAFIWIVVGFALLLFSIIESIPVWISKALGFGLVSNFLMTASIFFLLVNSFLHSLALSRQKEQIKNLVQELSIANKRITELESRDE